TTTTTTGPAYQIRLAGSPNKLKPGCSRTYTAYVEDADGNTVDDDTTQVLFFDFEGGGEVTFAGGGSATASNGVATMVVTGANNGVVKLRASASGLVTSLEIQFQVNPAGDCAGASSLPLGGGGGEPPTWVLAMLGLALAGAVAADRLAMRTRPGLGRVRHGLTS
ncbi:MAG: hypothetical protein HZA58_08935, partial [Acidimicrobiia bacterium]|nr:hypothetical protein [Acidimicrobiia bacterium]